ncbi:MAG: SagB/ThcOx family dehydrogenase, partial [Deltaproteobacteria bacterium]|nr:SagB/ThcOx family dehydrogenase [Deltaproteobacteria bacterium]
MSDLISASEYHRRTKYGLDRLPKGGLDASSQPETLKAYKNTQTVPFSKELVLPRIEAARALPGNFQRKPEPLSLDFLARLLYMSYGFTAQVDYQTEVFYYRSVPSAGALYPVEIYLTAKGVEGLEDGLYHYNLGDFSLDILCPGAPPSGIPAPAIFLSAIFFRSAWKYKERAFRYCLLDTGHVAENIGIISPTLGLGADFTADFDDHAVNEYLGLESEKEAVLGVLHLVTTAHETSAQSPENIPNPPESEPAAAGEILYDIITRVWEKTIQSVEETRVNLPAWPGEADVSLPGPDRNDFHGPTLVAALQNRRSRRNFKPKDIQRGDLSR